MYVPLVSLDEVASSLDSIYPKAQVQNSPVPASAAESQFSTPPARPSESIEPLSHISTGALDARLDTAASMPAVSPAVTVSQPVSPSSGSNVTFPLLPPRPRQSPQSDADGHTYHDHSPPGSLCELPDGTKVDISKVERVLENAAPILSRAFVYHLPGHTFFVSLLSLRTQPWQSVPPNVGVYSGTTLPHHLLHEDVVAAISARGSSAMTTMEAKSDK
jgi:hypothetical protein